MDVLQIQKDLIGMQDYMKNFARTLTKDEADAEDLTQDTTLRVLNNYDKFVDNVNFKGWVLKIMRISSQQLPQARAHAELHRPQRRRLQRTSA